LILDYVVASIGAFDPAVLRRTLADTFSDGDCRMRLDGWGGNEGVWFPGSASIDEEFKAQVGSYTCLNGTSSCPLVGLVSDTNSASAYALAPVVTSKSM